MGLFKPCIRAVGLRAEVCCHRLAPPPRKVPVLFLAWVPVPYGPAPPPSPQLHAHIPATPYSSGWAHPLASHCILPHPAGLGPAPFLQARVVGEGADSPEAVNRNFISVADGGQGVPELPQSCDPAPRRPGESLRPQRVGREWK